MKKSLESSEWILALSLVLILASLLLISRCHEHRKKAEIIQYFSHRESPNVEIKIDGEVSRPGAYSAVLGARLGDIIKKSQPKRFADLGKINLDSPVETEMTVEIPRLTELLVEVEGAVERPIQVRLPPGSRICDLKSKIECQADADLRYLKRRRLLKNGERVVIPRKVAVREHGEAQPH